MDKKRLIGMRVMNTNTHEIGSINDIAGGYVVIDTHGKLQKYIYPAAFSTILELEDEDLQEKIQNESKGASFDEFKLKYRGVINREIEYLRINGGKKYRIIDGQRILTKNEEYQYAFDTDTDLHYPDDTAIKLYFSEKIVKAYIVSCEDFTMINQYIKVEN